MNAIITFKLQCSIIRTVLTVTLNTLEIQKCARVRGGSFSNCIWRDGLDCPEYGNYIFLFDNILESLPDRRDGVVTDQKRDWSLLVKHKSIQTPSYMNGQPCINRLSDDFKKLLEDESLNSDVLLACGDCSFPAHKNVLSSRSDVFKTMLQSDMMESSTGSVEIADIEPTTFKEFLGYIYTGKLPELTVELATELYEVGDKYAVDALKARCGDILKENVTLENACGLLILADRHSDPEFKEYVMRYIVKEEIPLVSEEWSDFCSGHPDLAIEILNRAYRSAKSSSRRRHNFRQNYRGFRGRGRGRGSYNRNFDKTNEQGDKMNVTGITS